MRLGDICRHAPRLGRIGFKLHELEHLRIRHVVQITVAPRRKLAIRVVHVIFVREHVLLVVEQYRYVYPANIAESRSWVLHVEQEQIVLSEQADEHVRRRVFLERRHLHGVLRRVHRELRVNSRIKVTWMVQLVPKIFVDLELQPMTALQDIDVAQAIVLRKVHAGQRRHPVHILVVRP